MLKESVGVAGREEDQLQDPGGGASLPGIHRAHMALVNYCDYYLRQIDEGKL